MKKAIVVDSVNKTVMVVEKEWTLKQMQAAVGGKIEHVGAITNFDMFVNEEGLYDGGRLSDMMHPRGIFRFIGSALIMKGVDNKGNSTGFKDEVEAERYRALVEALITFTDLEIKDGQLT